MENETTKNVTINDTTHCTDSTLLKPTLKRKISPIDLEKSYSDHKTVNVNIIKKSKIQKTRSDSHIKDEENKENKRHSSNSPPSNMRITRSKTLAPSSKSMPTSEKQFCAATTSDSSHICSPAPPNNKPQIMIRNSLAHLQKAAIELLSCDESIPSYSISTKPSETSHTTTTTSSCSSSTSSSNSTPVSTSSSTPSLTSSSVPQKVPMKININIRRMSSHPPLNNHSITPNASIAIRNINSVGKPLSSSTSDCSNQSNVANNNNNNININVSKRLQIKTVKTGTSIARPNVGNSLTFVFK